MIMSGLIYVLYYIIIEPPFQGYSIRVITKNALSDLVPNTVKNMLTKVCGPEDEVDTP